MKESSKSTVADVSPKGVNRREFLRAAAAATVLTPGLAPGLAPQQAQALSSGKSQLMVGEAVVDITPPVGTVMSGFHYSPGNERRTEGVRQQTQGRAVVLQMGDTQAAIVSIDICAVGREYSQTVRQAIAQATGIPADHVILCATHTHSSATYRYFRQWGGLPKQYMASCAKKFITAVKRAQADLAPAELYVGESIAHGASFNRTRATWNTEDQFDAQASDDDRWLDRKLHVLHFERLAPKRNILWYHFSSHPVCFNDRQSGPDWPGVVQRILMERSHLSPSFLQGHCGDVNPGSGSPWLGVGETTGANVARAIQEALLGASRLDAPELRIARRDVALELNMELFRAQVEQYRHDPSKCGGGEWVDPSFAKSWYDDAVKWDADQHQLPMSISLIQLGGLGIFFHGSELFSYYGLKIRHGSPLDHTLCVGYTDDFVSYLTDPTSHANREYAASVVPRICGFPEFTPNATRKFSDEAIAWIRSRVS